MRWDPRQWPSRVGGAGPRAWVALSMVAWSVLVASPGRAAWPADPVTNLPVCTLPESQDASQVVADGTGGAIIVWQATDTDGVKSVLARRVDRAGDFAWGGAIVALSRSPGDQCWPTVASDSAGGVIVAWQDRRSGEEWDVYAQRIDHAGNVRWAEAGVRVSAAAGDQLAPLVAADGHGGVVVAWQDLRGGPGADLYAQAIDSAGVVRWAPDGIPVLAGAGAQLVSAVVTCAAGSMFVWSDSRVGGDAVGIYAQRVDGDGDLAWEPGGLRVADGAPADARPVVVSDDRGGVVVAWETGPIHAQRLDADGRRLWGPDGVALSSQPGSMPVVVPDGDGGAIVAWQTATLDGGASGVRAQSIRRSGALRWSADGVPLHRGAGAATEVVATPVAGGGAIVAWRDAGGGTFSVLGAQRVDSTGSPLWRRDGVPVCTAAGFQSAVALCADGLGGAIAVWTDDRAGRHIYAQRVGSRGRLGAAAGGRPAPAR